MGVSVGGSGVGVTVGGTGVAVARIGSGDGASATGVAAGLPQAASTTNTARTSVPARSGRIVLLVCPCDGGKHSRLKTFIALSFLEDALTASSVGSRGGAVPSISMIPRVYTIALSKSLSESSAHLNTEARLAIHGVSPSAWKARARLGKESYPETQKCQLLPSALPTDAELDSAFGTPGAVGAGFLALLDDNGAGSAVYVVASDGTNWWQCAMTKAV